MENAKLFQTTLMQILLYVLVYNPTSSSSI